MAVIKQVFVWLTLTVIMIAMASVDWWVNLI